LLSQEVCTTEDSVVEVDLRHVNAVPGNPVAAWQSAKNSIVLAPQYESHVNGTGLVTVGIDPPADVLVFENPQAMSRAYVTHNATVVQTWQEALEHFVKQEHLREKTFVEDGQDLCETSLPSSNDNSRATINALEPNRTSLTVHTAAPGILVLTDGYAKGWRALVDGKPANLFRANGAFRGVCIPGPGDYQVELTYEPPYWRIIRWGPLLALFLVMVEVGRRMLGKRRERLA
jgi:Bacterial membrane protein YfhO